MIPQCYPLGIRWRMQSEFDWTQGIVIGWVPVADSAFVDSPVGSRYAPVALFPDDKGGAVPIPTDGSAEWEVLR